MKGYIAVWLSAFLTLGVPLTTEAVQVNFDGELINLPCRLAPESTSLNISFPDRPVQVFQTSPARTPMQNINIRLMECDVNSVIKTVKLKFNGEKETAMKGQSDYFIRVSGINRGKLAVGLLDTTGRPLKLGVAHNDNRGTAITSTILTLNFKAFIQATPDAIAQRAVAAGAYQAVASFELSYE